ncbi:UNKNOWN [Stylonychia lemnae]|uniref:Uncharacterized protein n=1 Tax=Stylonychia lemnae TaxID=5949 RepID=A0A078AAM7_STYLE|nr:UNKNOWN [Stylonychia lemnae]|eukprot:CDW79335.1 UNKNOWN [Stylonychia lemnae]
MARRLYNCGFNREQARQQLRAKFHDPNDEKKRTIVAKIKKYIMKFWKDEKMQQDQNENQPYSQNMVQEQQIEQIQIRAQVEKEVNNEQITENPQETAQNLIKDLKELQRQQELLQQYAAANIQSQKNVIIPIEKNGQQDYNERDQPNQHRIMSQNQVRADEKINFFDQMKDEMVRRKSHDKNDNIQEQQARSGQEQNDKNQKLVGSKRKFLLTKLSQVIEEQDSLEQRLKRLKQEQKQLSEELACCQN